MAASSRHNGWRDDAANSRLDMYYRGTRVGHVDVCGITLATGKMSVPNCGVDFGSITLYTCGCTNTLSICCGGCYGGFYIANKVLFASTAQFLDCLGSDIFSASSCSEPSCAAKGVVWAWQGNACAVAPFGSAFLMITDDGCV